jgi:integrase
MRGCLTKYVVKGSSRPKWRYRVYIGKNEDGKKQFEGRAAFEKQSDAASAMRQHLEELRTRSTGVNAATPINLGAWLEKWLDTYAVDRCQPKTMERYRQLAIYLMKEPEGNASALAQTPLPDVTHMQIESALYSLLKAKGKRREHISARTVRHVGGLLSVALNKAFRLELVQVNPMLRVELPSVQPKDARSLTPLEIQGLRRYAAGTGRSHSSRSHWPRRPAAASCSRRSGLIWIGRREP